MTFDRNTIHFEGQINGILEEDQEEEEKEVSMVEIL